MIVKPDAKVVQRHPRRQTGSQAFQFMGALPPEAEGVEELVVDAFDDLAYSGHPSPQALGPAPLAAVGLGRVELDAHPVELEPAPMVCFTLEALVGDVGSPGRRAHAREPGVRTGPRGEEGFRCLLVGARGGREAKACNHPTGIDGGEKTEALIPP